MPNFNYTNDIPDTPNDPSVDQPDMKINTNSIDSIINVDHYSFNLANGGWHKQITLPAQNVPGVQANPTSTIYTNADAASASANSNAWYRNADGIFPLSAIRAAGYFVTSAAAAPAAITLLNGYNIVAINKTATTIYTVELNANAVTGNNIIVVTGQGFGGQNPIWSFVNPTITFTFASSPGVNNFSFVVLQI